MITNISFISSKWYFILNRFHFAETRIHVPHILQLLIHIFSFLCREYYTSARVKNQIHWGNPLGSPPSLGALYYHFAIAQKTLLCCPPKKQKNKKTHQIHCLKNCWNYVGNILFCRHWRWGEKKPLRNCLAYQFRKSLLFKNTLWLECSNYSFSARW